MAKQNKTLQEAAEELKTSLSRVHKAKLNFMRVYERSVDGQIDDAREKDCFRDKFDYQMRQDSSQR